MFDDSSQEKITSFLNVLKENLIFDKLYARKYRGSCFTVSEIHHLKMFINKT